METIEKMHMMDKMLRELLDITNSQTSLLKKIAQLEADNINLGNGLLDKKRSPQLFPYFSLSEK